MSARCLSLPALDIEGHTAIIKGECGIVVPENEMKWQAVRPAPTVYAFDRMDEIVRWAQQNALAVRGHTLLWHRPQWFPNWLNTYDYGANPVREAERLLTEHIQTVTRRYKGIITSYDVVNEAIDHDRNATIETSMSRAMGSPEAVLDLAFHTARAELPDAQLVYNDYMSWEPQHQRHCNDVLRLLEGYEQVIVANTRDHVAADPGVRQRACEGRGQSHRRKVRMHGQGDPCRDECDRQPEIQCVLFRQDGGEPFGLADRGDDAVLIQCHSNRYRDEGVAPRVDHRLHVRQQLFEISDRLHRVAWRLSAG
mgnify:CR=1 FL=1